MAQKRKVNRKRRRRRRMGRFEGLLILICVVFVCAVTVPIRGVLHAVAETPVEVETVVRKYNRDGVKDTFQEKLEKFAAENHLQLDAWPDELLECARNNSEMEDFVLNYPLKKDSNPKFDLSEYKNADSVPLFMQWDERWGYTKYAGKIMGVSGCGPTCLSMVSMYLLNDAKYTPQYVAKFSEENGYGVPGSGSSWTLISEGGRKLGLDVIEIPLDEQRIIRNLEVGNPIICVMGPGDFTTTGHFIVFTDYVDGKIKVNDPNSKERSEKLWDYDQIQSQIKNLWVCR